MDYPNKIALSILIFVAAVFALVYWLIIPAVSSVEATRIQMENQSLAAQRDYAQGQNLKKLKDSINTVEPRVGEIEQIFVNQNDSLSFVTSLETAAAENQVTENANLGSPTPLQNSYDQIPLQLTVNGGFRGLVGFITALENLKKYININSLQISPQVSDESIKIGTSTPEKFLKADISATTYWETSN